MSPATGDDALSSRPERLAARLSTLRRAVLEGKGVADRSTRQAAFSGEPLPAPLDDYLRKVRDDSYQVTDDDFARLRAAGLSEDELFELTIAAAIGAAERGLKPGLAVLRGSGGS